MAKFLTFETTAIKLNDSIFPSNSATFGLQAATVPVFDINGNLIDYAPNGPIQGKFSTEFYLTGALPDYLKFDNQSDAPISVSFNNFNIPSAFLTDLSFSVEPYQPISVSASFDFYHGIISLSTDLNDTHNLFSPADGTNKVKNKLATLNGLSSYIITYSRSTYKENPDDFIVSNFSYSFTVDRQPLLRVKQSIPSRVALKQVNGQFSITSNNIDGLLDIHGNDAIFNAVLADPQNPATYTSIGLTGIITDQNYVISDSNYGVGTVKMVQSITKKRNIISIPFGTNDPAIVEVSPPVELIFIPTPVSPVRPNPIPPPTPPPIIIVPPLIVPPKLDPVLIWFNIYVQPYDQPFYCSDKTHTVSQIKIAAIEYDSRIDGKDYIIRSKNIQPAVIYNHASLKAIKEKSDLDLPLLFMCSVGVNENVLNAVDPLLFPTFSNSDECSYEDNPTVLNKLAFQARGTNFINNEVNGKFECVLFESPSKEPNKETCYALKAYCTWNYLLGAMNYAKDNDLIIPNILPNSERIYRINFPFLAFGTKVFNNFSP
jgi:hypothetical protein